jgi:lipopolysaccharide export system ATP-binding protein
MSSHQSTLTAVGLQKKYGSRTVVTEVGVEVKSGEVVGYWVPMVRAKQLPFT